MSEVIHVKCSKCGLEDMISRNLFKDWAIFCVREWCTGIYTPVKENNAK